MKKKPYSQECVEGEFCELRHDGILRSKAIHYEFISVD